MPNEAKKSLLQKFKAWRIGRTDYSKGRLIGEYFNKRQAGTLSKSTPKEFDPKLSAWIFNLICRFLSKHRKWLLGFIASLITIYIAYLAYLKL